MEAQKTGQRQGMGAAGGDVCASVTCRKPMSTRVRVVATRGALVAIHLAAHTRSRARTERAEGGGRGKARAALAGSEASSSSLLSSSAVGAAAMCWAGAGS